MVKMLNGNVLTKVLEKEETGIIVNGIKNYKEVIVVEPDDKGVVEAGSHLYVTVNAGTPVKIKEENYLAINTRDIILIL